MDGYKNDSIRGWAAFNWYFALNFKPCLLYVKQKIMSFDVLSVHYCSVPKITMMVYVNVM